VVCVGGGAPAGSSPDRLLSPVADPDPGTSPILARFRLWGLESVNPMSLGWNFGQQKGPVIHTLEVSFAYLLG
jgi:hypothetical protein